MKKPRVDEDLSSLPTAKKMKFGGETRDDPSSLGVDDNELASAVALASLAAFSPAAKSVVSTEAREHTTGYTERVLSFEARSPREDPMPVTPDHRSPVRQGKRVTFAPNIKEPTRTGSRRSSFPPRINQVVSRMPRGFMRPVNFRPPAPMWPMPPMTTHMMQPRMPVQGIIQPVFQATQSSSQTWICDFCNVASFATYEDACRHENECKLLCRVPMRSPMWNPVSMDFPTPPRSISNRGFKSIEPDALKADSQEWFEGEVSLACPETDPDWLSELNCFIRMKCLEAFSATESDVACPSKRGRVCLKQVGIRCTFCKARPSIEREAAAVSFPESVAGIYESVKRWHRLHLGVCTEVPHSVTEKLHQLESANVSVLASRQYWQDSAMALGMVDTEQGIRFKRSPTEPIGKQQATSAQDSADAGGALSKGSGQLRDGEFIVFPDDIDLVPSYVYFLMRQVETCHFTEADRFVARSKGPLGCPGFQCRHCHGHAGLGKYFPISEKSLATNSTSQNIHAHLMKCRKCPAHIKEQLATLKEEKNKAPRLEPGWRKCFFDKVWERLHVGDKKEQEHEASS